MPNDTFDIEGARRTDRARREARRLHREHLWQQARDEADLAIRHLIEQYKPTRIIQWGSVLRPEQFSEISDIDIAIEGVDDMQTLSRIERELEAMVSFPLHLERFDRLHPEHQKQILMRGKVVYARADSLR